MATTKTAAPFQCCITGCSTPDAWGTAEHQWRHGQGQVPLCPKHGGPAAPAAQAQGKAPKTEQELLAATVRRMPPRKVERVGKRTGKARMGQRAVNHQERAAQGLDRIRGLGGSPSLWSPVRQPSSWRRVSPFRSEPTLWDGQGPVVRECNGAHGDLAQPAQDSRGKTYNAAKHGAKDQAAAEQQHADLEAGEEHFYVAPVVVAPLFREGDEVEHRRFGRGLVMEMGPKWVLVEFYGGKIRRFAAVATPECLDITAEQLSASVAAAVVQPVVEQQDLVAEQQDLVAEDAAPGGVFGEGERVMADGEIVGRIVAVVDGEVLVDWGQGWGVYRYPVEVAPHVLRRVEVQAQHEDECGEALPGWADQAALQ